MANLTYIEEQIDSYCLPSEVDKFFEYLEQRVEATGAARNEVSITVRVEDGYGGDHKAVLCLSYMREETPEEAEKRKKQERANEGYERKQYEKLKRKYGGQ